MAIFENRRLEPTHLTPYEDLLHSKRVVRIYLDEYQTPSDPPLGLGILQLVTAPESDLKTLVKKLFKTANDPRFDGETAQVAIELTEELLMRRFAKMKREEIRKMFQLTDIRKTAVWQEAREEGLAEGNALANERLVRNGLAKGMSVHEIADLLEIPLKEARRLAKAASKSR